jgi:hypothetical protein
MDDKKAAAERARRLNEAISRGPRAPRSPHEFVQDRMREERQRERPQPTKPSPRKSGSGKDC